MKNSKYLSIASIVAFLLILFAFSPAQARFAVPDYVYTVAQLHEAQAKAAENHRPLTFVGSNKDTTCPLATAATEDIFRKLRHDSVLVYVAPNDIFDLPAAVQDALRSKEAGRYIPKAVVINKEMNRKLCILPYSGMPQRENLINEVRSIIASYLKATPAEAVN